MWFADAPLIATSARRHGIRDDDMIDVLNHPILVEDVDDGFTMFVGADTGEAARQRYERSVNAR